MSDLLLVNPGNSTKMYQELTSPLRGIEPPFWAGLIASFIREHGYKVAILDADADNLSPEQTATRAMEYKPRLIAIVVQGCNPSASSTPKMPAARDLLKELKREPSHTKTLIGGLHPSALPERTLREEPVDFVCEGEGFYTILEWLRGNSPERIQGLHYRDGDSVSNPRAEVLPSGELPPVAWDLLDMTKYRAHNWHCLDDIDKRTPYGVIYTSLGCPYDCDICQIKQLYSGRPGIRFRKPEEVVREIDLLVRKYGVRHIKIMDELFAINERRVASFCDPIIKRGYDLNMWAYARVDRVTPPMLKKMKQAGINWVAYGIESASELARLGVAKKLSQERIGKAIEMARAADINIQANFIFGLPDDSLETMQETLAMAEAFNFEYVNMYCCTAYPGSQLYGDATRQGIKLPQNWADYGQYSEGFTPLPTKYLPVDEVVKFRDNAFREYFSRPEYLRKIEGKFGPKAREHIEGMLRYKIQRNQHEAKDLP